MNPNEMTYSQGNGGEQGNLRSEGSEEKVGATQKIGEMVSDKVGAAREYMQERGVRGLAADAGELVSRYPVTALAAGVGLGYLLGRALGRR